MPNITLSVSAELKREMEKHASVKWSTVVRSVILEKLLDFVKADQIAKNSKLQARDWERLSRMISKSAARHAEALLNEGNR